MPGRRSTSTSRVRKPKLSVGVKIPRTITIPRFNVVYLLMAIIVAGAFILGLVLGILITKVQYLEKGVSTSSATSNTTATTPDITTPVNVSVGHLPILGNKNAKVTVVEFADFQCPFCEQWFQQVEPNIIKNYVNTGKIQFAFRHYAFLDQSTDAAGPESTQAALASECADEQGKFWDYHDYLYNHQGQEDSGTFSIDNLKGFAATLGLNTDQFNSCLDSKKYASNVSKDMSEGQTAGVQGTPATFVNGLLFSGACPYSNFKQAIDYALAGTKFKISGSDGCTVSPQ